MSSLTFVTLNATARHTATIVFIHGLGDSGHGLKHVADLLRSQDREMRHIKWILPHAPTIPVTANGNFKMPSWFDIYSFEFNTGEDEAGMTRSKDLINQLVMTEIDSGIPPNRILVAGFSQGGVMSLLVGLTTTTPKHKLAGLGVLSGYLPLRSKFKNMVTSHASSTPIFWGYGEDDTLIKRSFSEESIRLLEGAVGSENVRHKGYPEMEHDMSPEELDDFKAFIKQKVPAETG